MTGLRNRSIKLGKREITPFMIGAMGVNLTTPAMAVIAAEEGTIGHISDAICLKVADDECRHEMRKTHRRRNHSVHINPDQTNIRFSTELIQSSVRSVAEKAMDRKSPNSDGKIFINIMEKLAMNDPVKTLKARYHGAMDGEIDGITLAAGLNTRSMALMADHPRFKETLIGIIVSSARALDIFLRKSRKYRLPDYIIVEGPLAGGHLGYSLEELKTKTLESSLSEVLRYLKKHELKIPVFVAGGIFNANDVHRFLNLGASGVQAATRFIIAQESGLKENIKQIYINATEKDVIVTHNSPSTLLTRLLYASPSLHQRIKPQCKQNGYGLFRGKCPYIDYYYATKLTGEFPVEDRKICLCHQLSEQKLWFCGSTVTMLKDVLSYDLNGKIIYPKTKNIIKEYTG